MENYNKKYLTIKIKCDCGGRYTYFNKSHHNRTKRHKNFINNNVSNNNNLILT